MKTKLLITWITLLSFPFNELIFNLHFGNSKSGSSSVTTDPLQFQMFNDELKKNSTYTLDVMSPNFQNFVAFQFAFDIEDAEFVSIKSDVLSQGEITYNWDEEEKNLGVIWLSGNGQPRSMAQGEILFSLEIKSQKDQFVGNVFSINEDRIKSEAVPDNFNESSIVLEFNFLERTSSLDKENTKPFSVSPNHLQSGANKVVVDGIEIVQASLYMFNGQMITNDLVFTDNEIQMNFEQAGMYVLKIYDGSSYYSEILTVQ